MLTIKNILTYQSFKNAKLVTGEGGLSNEVNGVILTSYYAMENVSPKKIDLFSDSQSGSA